MTIIEQIKAEIERRIALYSSLSENTVNPNRIDEDRQILSFLDTIEKSERPEPYNPVYDEAYLNEKIKKATESWKGVDVDAMLAECRGYDEEESKKPMNQDEELNNEIKVFVNEYGYEKSEDILLIAIVARHFAQWNAEHLANSNDEVVINGHKVAYDKDKDAITMEEIPNDLKEAAARFSKNVSDGHNYRDLRVGFIAGAKWQADHAPLPEDTVLFNKGVEEGRRLAEEEQADLFTIVALDAAQRAKEQMMKEAVEGVLDDCGTPARLRLEMPGGSFRIGDKVRVIVLPKED